jgi:hypothetical protein
MMGEDRHERTREIFEKIQMVKEDRKKVFEIKKIFWTSQDYVEDSKKNLRISKIKEINDNDDLKINNNDNDGINGIYNNNNDDIDNTDDIDDDYYDDDELSGVFPLKLKNTSDEERLELDQTRLQALVDDLRGDGDNATLVKRLEGDIDIHEILSMGHRINSKIVQKLPDFNQINWYLKNVTKIHTQDIYDMTENIKSNIKQSSKLHNEKMELIDILNNKNNEKYKEINHKSDNEHKVVGDLEKLLKYEGVNEEIPCPTKPIYMPLKDILYCKKIPGMNVAG